jgi:hypothetical protein
MMEDGHFFGATPLAPSHSNAATQTLTLTTSQKKKQIASAKMRVENKLMQNNASPISLQVRGNRHADN